MLSKNIDVRGRLDTQTSGRCVAGERVRASLKRSLPKEQSSSTASLRDTFVPASFTGFESLHGLDVEI